MSGFQAIRNKMWNQARYNVMRGTGLWLWNRVGLSLQDQAGNQVCHWLRNRIGGWVGGNNE